MDSLTQIKVSEFHPRYQIIVSDGTILRSAGTTEKTYDKRRAQQLSSKSLSFGVSSFFLLSEFLRLLIDEMENTCKHKFREIKNIISDLFSVDNQVEIQNEANFSSSPRMVLQLHSYQCAQWW